MRGAGVPAVPFLGGDDAGQCGALPGLADVGRAVAALVGGALPYATGTVIHIDGGLTIPRL